MNLAHYDLAMNPDHDESVPVDASDLAPHSLEVYWPQVRPYGVAAG